MRRQGPWRLWATTLFLNPNQRHSPTGKAHQLHTVALPLPCTASVVYNLILDNVSNDGVISYILQPQLSSTLPSQNAPAFSAPATSIILNSTDAPTPDTTPDPELKKAENAVQKCRRKKKEKKDEDLLMRKFLIDDNTRLKATIAELEQKLGLPQSQTSSMPPTSSLHCASKVSV